MTMRLRLYLGFTYFCILLLATVGYATFSFHQTQHYVKALVAESDAAVVAAQEQVGSNSDGETVRRLIASARLRAFLALPIMEDKVKEAQLVFSIMGVIAILSLSFMIGSLQTHLLAPLTQLSQFGKQLARGNIHLRFSSRKQDELSSLGQRFNEALDRTETLKTQTKKRLLTYRRLLTALFQQNESYVALFDLDGHVLLSNDFAPDLNLRQKIARGAEPGEIECEGRKFKLELVGNKENPEGWLLRTP